MSDRIIDNIQDHDATPEKNCSREGDDIEVIQTPYQQAAELLSTRLLPEEARSHMIENISSDDRETADRSLEGAREVDPWTFRIHYEDYQGSPSVRTITLHEVDYRYIRAWCHARKDWRTFRSDRVARIDLEDGSNPSPEEFFRQLGARKAMEDGEIDPVEGMKDFLRPGLAILVALGRSDGKLGKDEVSEIRRYVETMASKWGLDLDEDELTELGAKISRMRPSAGSIENYLRRIMGQRAQEREIFFDAMLRVASVDGEIHEEERALLKRIRKHADELAPPPPPKETIREKPSPTRMTPEERRRTEIGLAINLFNIFTSLAGATLVALIAHDIFGFWGYVLGEVVLWVAALLSISWIINYGMEPIKDKFGISDGDCQEATSSDKT